MGNLIIFREDKDKPGAIHFVESFRAKKWWWKEKISYSINTGVAETFDDVAVTEKVCERIKKDYPHAEIWCESFEDFIKKYENHRFWVVGRYSFSRGNRETRPCEEEFYCDNDRYGKPLYSTDLQEVRFSLSESSANETLKTIRKSTRDAAYTRMVFLTLQNELLSPCMMITCTSKGNGQTKYFSKLDGNRLRLVATSFAAKKFPYEQVMVMWEYLRQQNKNFLYAIMPVFKDNVNAKDIERYIRENHISRMIVMDLQLKHLNRGNVAVAQQHTKQE